MKMNRNTKIILGIGVGVGLAYLLYGRKKTAPKTAVAPKSAPKLSEEVETDIDVPDEDEVDVLEMGDTRDEQIAYILDNVDTNIKEEASGFEGTKFVWNPKLGRYYPVGVIHEGRMPNYADSVFYGFADEDEPVQDAVESLSDLSDKEVLLAFNLVKYRRKSPKAISEEEAVKEISTGDPKIIEIVRTRIVPRLNDIKVLKKRPNWRKNWAERRKKVRELVAEKSRVCGKRPADPKNRKEYRQCLRRVGKSQKGQPIFVSMKTKMKSRSNERLNNRKARQEKRNSFSGVEYNDLRQQEFSNEVTNRMAGGIFAGRRFDGRSNNAEETLVREGFSNGDGRVKPPRTQKGTPMSSADGSTWNDSRQQSFSEQVTNRMAGGMFAGRRFDGRSNEAEEVLVREGRV